MSRDLYARYLADRLPLEGLLPLHGDECEFDHCVCALSERKETDMPKGRDIDQQLADLAREKRKRYAHNDARTLIAQLKTNLHSRDYGVCLVQAQTLCKHLELLADVPAAGSESEIPPAFRVGATGPEQPQPAEDAAPHA